MEPIPLSLPILMDGATGTELQKRGMPQGACTEQWALEHPEALLELQRSYVEAGAGVLVTPTLGRAGEIWTGGASGGVQSAPHRAHPPSRGGPGPGGRGSGTHRTGHPPLWRDPF